MAQQNKQKTQKGAGNGPASSALSDMVEHISSKFDEVDKQHRGYIASGQLRGLLEKLGSAPQPLDQVRSIALLLDPDYSDKIKKQDFLRFWITREMAPKKGGAGSGAKGGSDSSSAPSPSSSLVADLAEAARARKEAQENAKLLANRVAMLREEKMKTIRCIADANKQAEKITAWKRKQEERRLERREQGKIEERKSREKHKQFAARKRLNMRRKAAKSEEIYKQKMEVAAAVRREKKAAQADKRRMERQYRDRARETHAGVQQLHKNLRQKKLQLAQKQAEAGQKAYTAKIKKERRLRRKNEKSISALEEEEAGLIQELQNAQLMQEDALSGLQYLLSTRVVGTE